MRRFDIVSFPKNLFHLMKDKQLKPVKDDGRKNKIYCDEAAAAQTLEVPRMHVGSLQRTFLHYLSVL